MSSIEQRRMILNSMKDIFINVSQDPAGAHVIQTIIKKNIHFSKMRQIKKKIFEISKDFVMD
jgi:hypothetical protein